MTSHPYFAAVALYAHVALYVFRKLIAKAHGVKL